MEYESNYLKHYGVLGMKWGVRRYQNADGSRTALGKRRERQDYHEDYTRAHDKKSVKYMSDQELRERNNRLQAEENYKRLNQSNVDKYVKAFISGAGTMTALVGAYATYRKIGKQVMGKLIDKVDIDVARRLV